ncbi:MAG: MurR/RpiR family transcriptional regulator [Anaerolineaceae bacterium]|nr:MurR/RpiR family transcriptional regulator [Anaerolineaceae bacterium]
MKKSQDNVNIFSKVRGLYASLSPSEKKVGDFVLNNHELVIRQTVSEVAENSGVSDATVIRFIRSLGFKRWLELKIELTRAIPDASRLIFDDVEECDEPYLIMKKVFQSSIQALEDTAALLKEEKFKSALDLIRKVDRILIIGVGTSAPMAQELFNRLFRLGLNCLVQTDSYIMNMQSALLGEDDLLIVISQTGDSEDPIRTAGVAKENECSVLCITGNIHSELRKYADVILLSVCHETRAETIASRIAQYAIIHALYVGLAMQTTEDTVEKEQKIWHAMMKAPFFQNHK